MLGCGVTKQGCDKLKWIKRIDDITNSSFWSTVALLLTTPECVRKDLCAHRNCWLTGSWEHKLRSSCKLKRTQQTFHFPSISTQWWSCEQACSDSGLFNSMADEADDRPRPCHFSSWLLLLYISPKQMPRLAAPSWIVSELGLNPKQAHMLPKPGLQRKAEGCPFGRRVNHLWLWQGIHPVSNLFESHLPWKISSLHITTLNRGQSLQRTKWFPLLFYIEAGRPPYAVEGGREFQRPQEKQTWNFSILCEYECV